MHRDEGTLLGLQWSRSNAGLSFCYQTEHIASAAEGEGETRTALPVRVDNVAEGPVCLLPELTFDPTFSPRTGRRPWTMGE